MKHQKSIKETNRSKRLKLQSKLRKVGYLKTRLVPELRMSGDWLSKLGFEIGSVVDVEMKQGELVLKIAQVSNAV